MLIVIAGAMPARAGQAGCEDVVQRIAIDVPDYGAASVYNTHLCSDCPGKDRLRQTESIIRFLDRHEDNTSRLVMLGGDFNTDITIKSAVEKDRSRVQKSGAGSRMPLRS